MINYAVICSCVIYLINKILKVSIQLQYAVIAVCLVSSTVRKEPTQKAMNRKYQRTSEELNPTPVGPLS